MNHPEEFTKITPNHIVKWVLKERQQHPIHYFRSKTHVFGDIAPFVCCKSTVAKLGPGMLFWHEFEPTKFKLEATRIRIEYHFHLEPSSKQTLKSEHNSKTQLYKFEQELSKHPEFESEPTTTVGAP